MMDADERKVDPLTLLSEVETLNRRVWENRLTKEQIQDWLGCFSEESERDHALYLLSQLMFFGQREVRTILSAVYQDLFRTPLLHEIRCREGVGMATKEVEQRYWNELATTRFLGCGNPAESGYHLLYYFRQDSKLWKELFVHPHELIARTDDGVESAAITDLRHLVFIDDICGSGDQALGYFRQIVLPLKRLLPDVRVHYLVMFATAKGLEHVRRAGVYDRVESVFLLDDSFRVFSDQSRYYYDPTLPFSKTAGDEMVKKHSKAFALGPYGYGDGQLWLGMYYNVPDNVLPMLWSEENGWRPIFKRYPKISQEFQED